MADDTIKQKPKRIVNRIGYVYCAEFGNGFKGYFQFVAKDKEQLGSEVIRAFYTHYPTDYTPVIEDIIKDKVAFYAHTFLTPGIKKELWYKVGKSADIGLEALEDVVFGMTHECRINGLDVVMVDPAENWQIWNINTPMINIGRLPEKYYYNIELGMVAPAKEIVNYLKYGYYRSLLPMYEIINRRPRPDADSFLRRENEGMTSYYHFYGEHAVEQIDIVGEAAVRLTKAQPVCDGHFLYDKPFGNTRWDSNEFITAEKFYAVWNSLNPAEVCRQHGNKKPESL